MKERSNVQLKKEEFAIREGIKELLGKGKISKIRIEYTPVGEKIIIATHKPGLVIGRRGEKIEEISTLLKNKFKLENPYIEVEEVTQPEFDAQIMADDIALSLERFGPLKFKVTAYRTLQRIIKAGAKGVEIRLNGKLPSSRAKSWRFAQGYLKKTGDPAKMVDKAQARAETKPGTVGVKVSILSPDVILKDQIIITDELIKTLKENSVEPDEVIEKVKIKKIVKKKIVKKKNLTPKGVPPNSQAGTSGGKK